MSILLCAAVCILIRPAAFAQQVPLIKPGTATLYLFWGKGCPHCAEEERFLQNLKRKYPGLVIRDFEVWYNRKNAAFFARVAKAAQVQSPGVPGTIIGRSLFIGFTEQTGRAIEEAVVSCLNKGCVDALAAAAAGLTDQGQEHRQSVTVPLVGEMDPSAMSLPLLTVIVGLLDSINPCAFFVLLFLLSMLIHAHSRKKMFLIGGIFVFFSGLIYFLFMAAWLNIFLIIGQVAAITVTAGAVALFIAGINIKDFFFFKKGVSLVIPERAKPKLFERMRNLLKARDLAAMVTGTVVLALFANAYELLCTVGFPMIYTRALTLHKLTTFQYYGYLVFYNAVYVIPLAVIVFIVTLSLGSRKLTEWQGRQLKLVSGLMMFFLGLILLVDPAVLNNALASALLLIVVIGLSGVVIAVSKKVRPEIAEQ